MGRIQQTTDRHLARPRVPSVGGTRKKRRAVLRRRWIAGTTVLVGLVAGGMLLRGSPPLPLREVPGTPAWARVHYGDPDNPGFKTRQIVEIEFLGRTMLVHRKVQRHFLRLESLFEARAPEYAAAVAAGTLDDWSYINRDTRGEAFKSNHAFGIAIDVNALANPLGTGGDIPVEVVRQWEIEGGDWGGDWSRPDPMHFESHLTPEQIRSRYRPDGTPKDWYLEKLIG